MEPRPATVGGLRPFGLERFFAKYEFSTPYHLCCSDCEPLSMKQTLEYADEECLQLWENLSLGYTESAGLPLLRDEIAKSYNDLQFPNWSLQPICSQDTLVVTPIEGIYIAARALLQPEDEIVVPCPSYQGLYEVAKSIGCKVRLWKFEQDEATGEPYFNIDTLRTLMNEKTKLVVTNFPHNPTGSLLSHKELKDVISLCEKYGSYLFSDEMYRGLELNPDDTLPSACQVYSKAISLSGVSKTLGLPGVRIGWLVSKNEEIMRRLKIFKDYTTICPPAPSEILALIALRARHKLIKENLEIIRNGLAALEAFAKGHPNVFQFYKPKGGSICFLKLLRGDSHKFCEALVKEAGILLLPSQAFADVEKDECRVRFGVGRKNVPEFLEILNKVPFDSLEF